MNIIFLKGVKVLRVGERHEKMYPPSTEINIDSVVWYLKTSKVRDRFIRATLNT